VVGIASVDKVLLLINLMCTNVITSQQHNEIRFRREKYVAVNINITTNDVDTLCVLP
jgi:hypothetical protein